MIRTLVARHRPAIFHWGMEIVIVVIGILIAFTLQGWSEDIAARKRAADAEVRIRAEIIDNAYDFIERIAIYPCVRARVEELSRGLVAGDPNWRPRTSGQGIRQSVLPIVYPVPSRSSSSDVYRGALGAGELARVAPDRRADLAKLYKASDRLDEVNREENALADQLQPLQFAVTSTQPERNAMLGSLARLDSINGLARLMAHQFLARLRKKGFRLTPAEIDAHRRDTWLKQLKYDRGRYGPCVDATAIGAFEPALLRRANGDGAR